MKPPSGHAQHPTPATREKGGAGISPIVIIGRQRSGTTVFRELLVSMGAFDVGEIFHRQFQNNRLRFFRKVQALAATDPGAIHPIEYPRIFRSFLDEVNTLARGRPPALDIKYNALRIVDAGIVDGVPAAIRLCAERGARFVHLRRRNLLRVQVSLAVAQATGKWGETMDGAPIPLAARRVKIDPVQAMERVAADEALAQATGRWLEGLPHHDLTYETMFSADGSFATETLETAAALIGTSKAVVQPALRQQNPESMADLVVNYDALARVFSASDYAWMLQE